MQRDQIDHAGVILLIERLKRLGDGAADLVDMEIDDFSVPFNDLIHEKTPLVDRIQYERFDNRRPKKPCTLILSSRGERCQGVISRYLD